MAGVFVHPELVVEPGVAQFGAALLVLVATIGITFSLQAVFIDRPGSDMAVRVVLAGFALVILLCPDNRIATAACIPVLGAIGYWLAVRRTEGGVSEITVAEPVAVAAAPIVDTERGRMQ
jgi:hypothetical protein